MMKKKRRSITANIKIMNLVFYYILIALLLVRRRPRSPFLSFQKPDPKLLVRRAPICRKESISVIKLPFKFEFDDKQS